MKGVLGIFKLCIWQCIVCSRQCGGGIQGSVEGLLGSVEYAMAVWRGCTGQCGECTGQCIVCSGQCGGGVQRSVEAIYLVI